MTISCNGTGYSFIRMDGYYLSSGKGLIDINMNGFPIYLNYRADDGTSLLFGNPETKEITIGGTLISGPIKINERSSDPANPSEGSFIMWMSDGTGTGEDGDIMIKITAGGVTKVDTLMDFSGM